MAAPVILQRAPEHDDAGFGGPWFVDPDEIPDHLLDRVDPATQGDDRIHIPGNPLGLQPLRSHSWSGTVAGPAKAVAPVRVVPHHRDVKLGTVGPDSVAVKRALSRLGYIRWRTVWTRLFGLGAVVPLRRFQRDHGLAADGVYGIATHRKAVALGGFDRHGAYLMGIAPYATTPEQRKRAAIVAAAMWGYHNRDRIHYAQIRPIDGHRHPWKLPLYTDCSGTTEDWYEWGGGPDPSELGFDGQGYTGTQVSHGVRTGSPVGGDLNFYGWDRSLGAPMHVTVQVSAATGSDLAVSHGNEAGPSLVPRRYWSAYYESRSYL